MTATYRRQQGSKVYTFKSLADLMAKATPERSGDALAPPMPCWMPAPERMPSSASILFQACKFASPACPARAFLLTRMVPF